MKDFDKAVKLVLLLLIAACVAGILFAVLKPAGKSAAGAPGAPGAASAAGAPGARAAASGAASTPGERPARLADNAITVEAVTLAPQTLTKSIKINGDVVSRSQVSVFADTPGKLTGYEVSVGSVVEKGAVVAYVDPSKPGSAYAASPVRASIAGTVISLPRIIGENVSLSVPVAVIGDLESPEIITYVSEKYSAVLKNGLPAQVSLVPFPDERFDASVIQISPVVDASSRTVEVRLSVRDPRLRLKPGMFAVITLVTQDVRNAKVVPKTAVRTYNADYVVYVADRGNKARRRTVTTGLSNDTSVQLVTGVEFGDRVIVSGSVSEGTAVRVADGENRE